MKGRGRVSFLLPLLTLLSSCTLGGDFGRLLQGNADHRGGRYEAAAAAYLSVRSPSLRAIADYDLANSWARLGEDRAAEALYATALTEGDARLRHDAFFNRAVLSFERGRFEAAYRDFKEALRLDAADSEARLSLEVAWRAWQKEGRAVPNSLSLSGPSGASGSREEFRLLRRLETGTWRPAALPNPSSSARDF
ncbi:MAG: tetratricopeptide repeat protein [Spirochaetota bacterium]